MQNEELKQRIKYLIEHGGVWETARDKNDRWHRIIISAVSISVILQLIVLTEITQLLR